MLGEIDLERFQSVWAQIMEWFKKIFDIFKNFIPSTEEPSTQVAE